MKPTFYYHTTPRDVLFMAVLPSSAEARGMKVHVTLCGVSPIQEENRILFQIPLERKDEAILDLEHQGYPTDNIDNDGNE